MHLLIFLLGGFCAGLADWLAGCDHASFAGGRSWTAGVEARLGRGVASRVDSDEWLNMCILQIYCMLNYGNKLQEQMPNEVHFLKPTHKGLT